MIIDLNGITKINTNNFEYMIIEKDSFTQYAITREDIKSFKCYKANSAGHERYIIHLSFNIHNDPEDNQDPYVLKPKKKLKTSDFIEYCTDDKEFVEKVEKTINHWIDKKAIFKSSTDIINENAIGMTTLILSYESNNVKIVIDNNEYITIVKNSIEYKIRKEKILSIKIEDASTPGRRIITGHRTKIGPVWVRSSKSHQMQNKRYCMIINYVNNYDQIEEIEIYNKSNIILANAYEKIHSWQKNGFDINKKPSDVGFYNEIAILTILVLILLYYALVKR